MNPETFHSATIKKDIEPAQLSLGSDFDILHIVNPAILESMSPIYKLAYEKSRKIVQGNRIHIDGFTNYKDLDIDRQAVVEKVKRINSQESLEGGAEAVVQAEILEALIYDMVKNHQWFGPLSSAILPSNYDDLFLGNDIILEQKLEGGFFSYSGVGIDITIGEPSLLKKLEITKRKLRKGELGKVKYFMSPNSNHKGELDNIPHFVIGVDRDNLFRLVQAWSRDDYESLKKDKTRQTLLKMMILECDEFAQIGGLVKEIYMREKFLLEKMLRSIS